MLDYTKQVIENLSKEDMQNLSKGWYLEHNKVRSWHKLGHADEEVLLYYLELHLYEIAKKLGENKQVIEKAFEKRRAVITERLKFENEDEYGHLQIHLKALEQKLKKDRPELHQEIMKIRDQIQAERKKEEDS